MAQVKCPQCGASVDSAAKECKYCGEAIPAPEAPQQAQQPQYAQQPNVVFVQNQMPPQQAGIDPYWPVKSKVTAGLLAILLGGIGIHKFYLGQGGMGVLYLLFSWTFIPMFVGFIEGIVYLTTSDYNFQVKNRVRIQ